MPVWSYAEDDDALVVSDSESDQSSLDARRVDPVICDAIAGWDVTANFLGVQECSCCGLVSGTAECIGVWRWICGRDRCCSQIFSLMSCSFCAGSSQYL